MNSALTSREKEVLNHITSGLTNKAIARRLGIARSTVKGHCAKIYLKLGVSNRTQAAVIAAKS